MQMRILIVCVALGCASTSLPAQLRVVTTTPDLADLARMIGGDAVNVRSLTSGREDLHLVRPRPTFLVRLRRADVFIEMGMGAEHAWVPALMRNARNSKILPGQPGFINASAGIKGLRRPSTMSRANSVDLHPQGNPHFNLGFSGMSQAAKNISLGLSRRLPAQAASFARRLKEWQAKLQQHRARWIKTLAPFKGRGFIEDHDAWIYFATDFGLKICARLEPKPGLSPTPAHLAEVIRIAKAQRVKLVIGRPARAATAKKVAKQIGGAAIVWNLGCNRDEGWFKFMDSTVSAFAQHLGAK